MALAQSKLTAQGQISVPAKVRKKLGLGPGSVLEWETDGDKIVVKRAGRFSSNDIHEQIFTDSVDRKTSAEMKEGIKDRMRKRYAKR